MLRSRASICPLFASQFNHGNGKPTILLFWEKFATGDYKVNEQVADWVATLGDKVNAIGVSVDATKADAEKYVSRLGKHLEEQRVTMKMVPNVAWDEDKKLSEEFKKVCRLAVMGPSNMFLISESGRIMWRERFSQTYEFEQGLFKRQTENLLANVKLVKVGKQPEEEAEEEEVELDSDDDGALF